jgi:hypothetical protein
MPRFVNSAMTRQYCHSIWMFRAANNAGHPTENTTAMQWASVSAVRHAILFALSADSNLANARASGVDASTECLIVRFWPSAKSSPGVQFGQTEIRCEAVDGSGVVCHSSAWSSLSAPTETSNLSSGHRLSHAHFLDIASDPALRAMNPDRRRFRKLRDNRGISVHWLCHQPRDPAMHRFGEAPMEAELITLLAIPKHD